MAHGPFCFTKTVGEETMFDMNRAIDNWRCKLEESGKIGRDNIDELESHLRDEFDQLAEKGPINENIFNKAIAQIGDVFMLGEEFSKVDTKKSEFIGIIQNGILAMNAKKNHSDRFIMTLFFIGFCGIIGWFGTTCWMLQGWTNSQHWTSLGNIIGTIVIFSLPCSFFLISSLVCIPWGLKLLKANEHKRKFLIRPFVPAILLSPVYIFVGMVIILSSPWWGGWAKATVVGYKVVQSQLSPDGKFEAYVIDKPSFDGPNHHLYIRRNDVNFSEGIGRLPEDVDSIKKIHWSPFSDIVVFETWFSLIAVRVSDYKMVKIPLVGEKHWRENGTFWVDYGNVKRPEIIEFPEVNTFVYSFKDSDEIKTIDMASF